MPPAVEVAGPVADGTGKHHREAAGLAAQDDRPDQLLELAGGVVVGADDRGEPVLGLGGLPGRVGAHDLDPVLDQAVAGLLEQEPADDADHDGGQQTVLTTMRAWIERRQKVRPRRTAAVGLRAATGTYAVPALYPTPRTVTTISGFSGSCSTFERSRCTCTLTSRVSAACR